MFNCYSALFVVIFISGVEMCSDSRTNCASWAANGFCTSTFYTDAQKTEYCGATCNLCGGSSSGTTSSSDSTVVSSTTAAVTSSSSSDSSAGTTSGSATCKDNASACASWAANGYCTNTFYTVAQRQQNCAQTCGLC